MLMRHIYTLFAIALAGTLAALADIPPSYYSKLDGKKKEELKDAVFQTVRPHTVVTYNSLFPQQFPHTDVYPELYDGKQRWWEMYSDMVFYVMDGSRGMNREHSFPKSWWGGEVNEAYTDLNHLYPAESAANMAKSNYPLGEVQTAKFDNGVTTVGYPYSGQGGGAGQVFEPADEYKGDFARTYFYMATTYQDYTWKWTYMVSDGAYPTLKPWAYNLLLDWARRDPVSQKELDRNEAVYMIQGNRNPYIDFPELAEYIWGTRTTETFYVKDQGQGPVTPPVTGDPELFAPIDGSSLDFGEVATSRSQSVELLVNGINLTSSLSVRVTGTDRKMFTVLGVNGNQIPASSVNAEGGYKLTVRYTPASEGEHTAALTLYDGGFPDGKNFNVSLHGRAFPIPTLTAPVAIAPADLTDSTYTARWQMPPENEVVDSWMVNRTVYLSTGAAVQRLTAEENALEIDGRDPSVAESYTVQSVRLGFESPESNLIMVAAGSALALGMDEPLAVQCMPGGLRLILHTRHTGLRITGADGALRLYAPSAEGFPVIALPAGVYLVSTDQSPRPLKVIVRN